MIMAYHLLLQLLQAREGEEEDDHGQLKKETVAVKQEVADDFMVNLAHCCKQLWPCLIRA